MFLWMWVGQPKDEQCHAETISHSGSVCSNIISRHHWYLLWAFWSVFSTDAMQWYVRLGSSSAGCRCFVCEACCSDSVVVTRWGLLYLKGTQQKGSCSQKQERRRNDVIHERTSTSKHVTPHNGYDTKANVNILQKSDLSFAVLWYAFSYCMPLLAVGGLLLKPIVCLAVHVYMSGVSYVI